MKAKKILEILSKLSEVTVELQYPGEYGQLETHEAQTCLLGINLKSELTLIIRY
jgi:hypothetical protein